MRVPLGWSEAELAPVWHDFSSTAAPDRDGRHREWQDQPAAPGRPRGDPVLHARPGQGCPGRPAPRAVRRGAAGYRLGYAVPRRWPARSSPRWRATLASGCPARTSRPSSFAAATGGPVRRCSSSSTTTTWSRPRQQPVPAADRVPAAGLRHRAARHRGQGRSRLGADVGGPDAASHVGVEHAGCGALLPAAGGNTARQRPASGVPARPGYAAHPPPAPDPADRASSATAAPATTEPLTVKTASEDRE